MEQYKMISNIAEVAFKGGFTIGGLVLIFLSIIIWRRTRSSHILMSKLWVLFNGKENCEVLSIKDFLNSQSAVLRFRFMTGIQARTVKHAETLIFWTKKNDEDIGAIAACGKYFDLELPGLKDKKKLPKVWFLYVLGLVAAMILLSALFIFSGVFLEKALLRMNDSETWFLVDDISAKPLSQKPGFKIENCSGDFGEISKQSGFISKDVDIICKSFISKDSLSYIKQNIHAQRILFSAASLYLIYFFFIAFSSLSQGVNSIKMLNRLKRMAVIP